MLELKNIKKDYKSGDTVVQALKGVSMSFRDNEFVSILGPSGCGKTTLLNLVGGLDSYTSGDLVINGRSTKEFKSRDWDVYRNHRVGFIFQSYNLIPHQTVLGNVELALTIAGIGKQERVERAKAALDKVGLSDQYNKRPNQLSGGQCQRVAIARALVNDPEILLADEPTGALDTKTSVQIMDLIQEIAKDRLVIMVTHNPELAEKYSTRIIQLLDGNLVSDTNPISAEEMKKASAPAPAPASADPATATTKKKKENAKMSFFTAFRLSLQNLFTKKARTIMTSVAGSIGIIGISMVLSISWGVQGYIQDMQNDMLSGNPITVSESSLDITALMQSTGTPDVSDFVWKDGKINVDATIAQLVKRSENMSNLMQSNEITQNYIDYLTDYQKKNPEALAAVMLDYGLNLGNNIYTDFYPAKTQTTPADKQNISLAAIKAVYTALLNESPYAQYSSYISTLSDSFSEVPSNQDYILGQYDLLEGGKYAVEADEVMLVLKKESYLSDLMLAQMGFFSQNEFMNLVFRATQGRENESGNYSKDLDKDYFDYSEVYNKEFVYYPNGTVFKKHTGNISDSKYVDEISFDYLGNSNDFNKNTGIPLKVVGILQPKADLSYGTLSSGFYYTEKLRERIFEIEQNETSQIVQELQKSGSVKSNVTTVTSGADAGKTRLENIIFKLDYTYPYDEWYTIATDPAWPAPDFPYNGDRKEDGKIVCLSEQLLPVKEGNKTVYKAAKELKKNDKIIITVSETVSIEYTVTDSSMEKGEPRTVSSYAAVGTVNEMASMAGMIDAFMPGMGTALGAALSGNTLTLRELSGRNSEGVTLANYIEVYPNSFETKAQVLEYLDAWNTESDLTFYSTTAGKEITLSAADRADINYQDVLSIIASILNTLINVITSALVGFMSLSLVVSTVMIAIITYVSVVERVKEIGVIRSLGGRKLDVGYLFNAETFIIGLISGLIGIGFTYFASWIINLIVGIFAGVTIAVFPWYFALLMVGLSIFLTLISGLFPSFSASQKDPVVALRSE